MSNLLNPITYNDSIPIKVELLEIDYYPIHNHSDLQIIYVLEGEVDLKLAYSIYHLKQNNIHVIHSDDVHSITKTSPNNLLLVVSINIEYFEHYFPNLGQTVFTTNISETSSSYHSQQLLCDKIFSIASEQYYKREGYSHRMRDGALSLMYILTSHFRGVTIEKQNHTFEHKNSHDLLQTDRISRIVNYIYQNYPYKPELAEIAEKEKISLYYLSHLFQKYMGISFRNFISLVRIEMSEPHLLATDDAISKIAQDVGFSDTKYYVDNFIRYFGHHPKEHRKLFADKTILNTTPIYKKYSLDKIKNSISAYTHYPVFKNAWENITVIHANFNQNKTKGKVQVNPFARILENLPALVTWPIAKESCTQYSETNPQKICIETIDYFQREHKLDEGLFRIIDCKTKTNGLFAINGLKKPLYYFMALFEKLPLQVAVQGKDYIILTENGKLGILAFNASEDEDLSLSFKIGHLPDAVKITKSHLRSQNTFAAYWSQLNFNVNLSHEEFEAIERMSMPELSWEIISTQKDYEVNCELAPLDVITFIFEEIQNN